MREVNNRYKKGLFTDSEHRLAITYMLERRLSTLGVKGDSMTMRELKRAIHEMTSRGSEEDATGKLTELYEADEISREQYSYALRSINLYFTLKDDQ